MYYTEDLIPGINVGTLNKWGKKEDRSKLVWKTSKQLIF